MKKTNVIFIVFILIYTVLIAFSFLFQYEPGKEIGQNFWLNCLEMIKIFPFAFLLIGLFEVWIKKETVEKHLGKKSGPAGYLWVILLGGATIGPMVISLPIAYSLYKKGARLAVVFTYIGAAAVCRIPMTLFEASYMGIKFTVIRYAVSIPLILITAALMAKYLEKKNYQLIENEDLKQAGPSQKKLDN